MHGRSNPSARTTRRLQIDRGRVSPAGARLVDAGHFVAGIACTSIERATSQHRFLKVDKKYAQVQLQCAAWSRSRSRRSSCPARAAGAGPRARSRAVGGAERTPPGAACPAARCAAHGAALPTRSMRHITIFYGSAQFAFGHLLADAGFEIERLEWHSATASFQLECAATWLPRRPSAFGRGARRLPPATAVAEHTAGVQGAVDRPLARRVATQARRHRPPEELRRRRPRPRFGELSGGVR